MPPSLRGKYLLLVFAFFVVVVVIFYRFDKTSQDKNSISKSAICSDCNVIVVAYDALQAEHVSHLGYGVETTPMIDTLAKQGVSFGNAISAASWTVPSYMSIFTGLYPSEHKVVNKFSLFSRDKKTISNLRELSPDVQTLAEVFKANGYATGGFTGDAGVSAQFGYDKGFDVFTDEKVFGSMENSAGHALEWLEKNKENKFFMFLHGYDSHGQYKVEDGYKGRFMPADYKGKFKGTSEEQRVLREDGLAKGSIDLTEEDVEFWRGWYDSKIRDADDRFAEFWQDIDRLGVKDKTIIIILSDHGTEFYEHKRFDHGFSLYDELVHVPLVFTVPGLSAKGIIPDQVTTLDVAPTLFDIIGIDPGQKYKSQMRGKSLLSYLQTGKGESRDVFMETDYRNYTHKRGVRTADGWKFIWTMETGMKELYDLKNDPLETRNMAMENKEVSVNLEKSIEDFIETTGQNLSGPWNVGCVPVYVDQCK